MVPLLAAGTSSGRADERLVVVECDGRTEVGSRHPIIGLEPWHLRPALVAIDILKYSAEKAVGSGGTDKCFISTESDHEASAVQSIAYYRWQPKQRRAIEHRLQ